MKTSNLMKIADDPSKIQKIKAEFTVCVVGCGKMGLPTACLFADAGFRVIGVDKNREIVESINKGVSPFKEPGIEKLLRRNLKEGRLMATSDAAWAFSQSDVILIVVDTPIDEKFKPDYSRLEAACKEIGKSLRIGMLVVVTSTVGPGITETLVRGILERASGLKAGRDFGLAFSPTLASPGRTLYDISHYARLVAGIDLKSLKVASAIFTAVVKAGVIPLSSIRVAEAVKLFQNVYRDVNLALANEFALFCEKAGIDYVEVWKAANTNPYYHFLLPGIVSGHIPKDPYLLINEAENLGVKLRMAKLARDINESVVDHAVKLTREVLKQAGKPLRGARIAVLGVSYKANVKEPKGSRAIKLVKMFRAKGAKVKVYDPHFSKKELQELGYPAENTVEKAVKGADCILITVGHDQFKKLNFKKLRNIAKCPLAVVDLANVIGDLIIGEKIILRQLGKPGGGS